MNSVIARLRKVPTDIVIKCKNGEATAIKAMLNGVFIEKDGIVMPEDTVEIVQAAINYIQFDEIPNINEPEEVLFFLHKYDVEHQSMLTHVMSHLKNGNAALRTYNKIINLQAYDELKKAARDNIVTWLIDKYKIVCDKCNHNVNWKCAHCMKASYTYDTECEVEHCFKETTTHEDCKHYPKGNYIVSKQGFTSVNYELIGRAVYDYFIGENLPPEVIT